MKHFKALFAAAFMLLCTLAVKAQDVNSSGFTIQVYIGMYEENGETKSYNLNEIYNISLTDLYLVHNVMSEDLVSDSQLYKISNLQRKDSDGIASFSFNATSGVSGNVYKYEVALSEGIATVERVQPNGDSESFIGSSSRFKTYQQ